MRKLTAIILSIAMVLTALVPTLVFADPVSQPEITIVGSTIKGSDEYFELTLEVNSNGVGFSTVGTVLQYDSSVIVPVAWDEQGTEIPLGGTSDWQNIAAVPSVADTRVSGKTALTYKDGESSAGYLYLGSEMPLPDCSAAPVVQPSDPSASPIPDPNIVRTVTVRFKYVGTGADADAILAARQASKQKVIDNFAAGSKNIVTLAPDAVAAGSPAGQSVVYSADESMTEFYYTQDDSTTVGLKYGTLLTAAPGIELELDAESANAGGGGADPANFAPLVFFDWDETTLLGSMVVDGSAPKADIDEYMNSFALSKLPVEHFSLSDMCDYDTTTDADKTAAYNNTTYDANYPLTSHDGYTFGKWIDFDGPDDRYTVYGEAPLPDNNIAIVEIPEPANPSYDKIKSGLVLKAAYIANSKIDPATVLTTNGSRVYSISNTTDPNDRYFGKFDGNNYAVRATIVRNNNDATNPLPVQRARESAAVALITIKDASGKTSQFYSLAKLENVDQQMVEFAVPNNATNVRISFRDIAGVPNWATKAAVRSAYFDIKGDDIILYGSVDYLNEFAETYTIGDTAPTAPFFTSAGLTLKATNVAGRKNAMAAIKNAQTAKGSYLTQAEMQAAITAAGA